VDERQLTVGFGPFRGRRAVATDRRVRTTTYRWLAWAGLASVPVAWESVVAIGAFRFRLRARKDVQRAGDKGIAVQVILRDGRRLLFSSPIPPPSARLCESGGRRLDV